MKNKVSETAISKFKTWVDLVIWKKQQNCISQGIRNKNCSNNTLFPLIRALSGLQVYLTNSWSYKLKNWMYLYNFASLGIYMLKTLCCLHHYRQHYKSWLTIRLASDCETRSWDVCLINFRKSLLDLHQHSDKCTSCLSFFRVHCSYIWHI